MVSHIAWFEYILTDSELEALVLECNLIKEHRPRYNTMLKDDKTYPYIKATVGEDFPRLLFSRDMKKDGRSRYFGPYTSAGAVKDTLDLIHKLYRIRTCSRNLPKDTGKERPCLNYHIKQCDAPCQGYISKEDYQKSFGQALDFLGGHYEPLLRSLKEKMEQASEQMEFEKAIEYRELLNSVKQVAQKQKITSSSMEDRDIVALARDERDAVVQVFFIREGKLIVYTSADSVLQICGNEETMGLETLYHYCEIARELTMRDAWRVGRVIARPYVGKKKGEFVRTSNRRDYALKPTGPTALNALQEAGYDVLAVGKIHDIFDGYGITKSLHSTSSVHGMDQTIALAQSDFCGLCFTNLVDFDALWGHRRNPIGYGEEIERFDKKLGELMPLLKKEDLLMITADHGNDPTYKGTDHTREQVPLLLYSPSDQGSGPLPTQDTFAVIGATIADNFGVQMPANTIGTSLLPLL